MSINNELITAGEAEDVDEGADDVTVVQPNEDGSYWRKLVRNKMKRTREMKRQKAAAKWLQDNGLPEHSVVIATDSQ